MDIAIDTTIIEEPALSYDDTTAYEDQLPTEAERASLASRIGTSKVYLLEEVTAPSRVGKGKRKRDEDEENRMEEDEETEADLGHRPNAILMKGSPIANLPTARVFAYARHFDTRPLGLEWVDDITCVLVFESNRDAIDAFNRLLKSATEEPDMDELLAAKPFPMALWPPEARINSTLAGGHGLKGPLRMRWARSEDVKKKGAKQESQFYRKHGDTAGKEVFEGRDLPPAKRWRHDDNATNDADLKAQLDKQLDEFAAEDVDEEQTSGSPLSKMRSDYIAADGRTVVAKASLVPGSDGGGADLASRLSTSRRPRGRRGRDLHDEERPNRLADRLFGRPSERLERGSRRDSARLPPHNSDGPPNGRRNHREKLRQERPAKTQEELDADLDAFMQSSA